MLKRVAVTAMALVVMTGAFVGPVAPPAFADTTAPEQVIDLPADAAVVPSPATLSGSATDDVGVASVQITIVDPVTGDSWDGSAWQASPTFVLATLSAPDTAATDWSYVFDLGSLTPSAQPYQWTALAVDTSDNPAAAASASTFSIEDEVAPVITLVGDNPQTIQAGDPYTELGATAIDDVDGDISGSIVIDATAVVTSALGSYEVTYDVSDAAGNAATQVIRTVDVVDTTPPVIELVGANPQTIEAGDPYTELGATATDNLDGDISGSIMIDTSEVDIMTPGLYGVRYNVTDSEGNAASEVVRGVVVEDTTLPTQTILGPDDAATESAPVLLEGTAEDNSGVAEVELTVFDQVASKYWNGGAWQSAFATFEASLGTPGGTSTTWSYSFGAGLVPSTMPYLWTAQAIDGAANASASPSMRSFSIPDETPPVIILIGPNPQTVEVNTGYGELGAQATDAVDGDLTADIVIDATAVNTAALGDYIVTYNVSDAAGNAAPEKTRTVSVVDTTKPVVTLLGDNPQSVEAGTAYDEQGATATDNFDGDISHQIIIGSGSVNPNVIGMYFVTYRVTDSSGNQSSIVIRTVNVADTIAPEISLIGDDPQSINIGDPYAELGATALDSFEGDLTSEIVIDAAAVDTSMIGSYPVTYTVADSSGNETQVTRTVTVGDPNAPVITLLGDDPQVIELGDPYVELGATALDDVEGDITGDIVIDASAVDTSKVGSYEVTYDVSDSSGNASQAIRTVDVIDVNGPVISLLGDDPQVIRLLDPYVELGATALDDGDGDVSGSIVIDASGVDTSTVGTYQVTYDVVDSSGNAADQVVRTVEVVDPFSDVAPGSWYYTFVTAMFLAGWTDGFPDGTFRPDEPVTRAQAAKFLIDAMGETPTTPATDPFPDVPKGHWAAGYIERLAQLGIVGGFPDGTFHPDEPATRAAIAKMVIEAMGETPTTPTTDPFPDVPKGYWAAGYIERLVQLGIVDGFPDGTFRPNDVVTRAQIAKIITEGFLP